MHSIQHSFIFPLSYEISSQFLCFQFKKWVSNFEIKVLHHTKQANYLFIFISTFMGYLDPAM